MTKKKSGKKTYSQKIPDILKLKFVLLGTLLGLVIAGFTAVILTSMNKSQAILDSNSYHPATYAVADKFMCGCPDCNKELRNCDCSHSDGGVYELYYISEKLKEGLSEEQVITTVNEKFGRIKTGINL